MKCRHGFVSNSSSASCIINLNAITPDQLEHLVRYYAADPAIVAQWKLSDYHEESDGDGAPWFLEVIGNHIRGTTNMSDYDLHTWATFLDIPEEAMTFEQEHHRMEDNWTVYQFDPKFREEAQQYLGE